MIPQLSSTFLERTNWLFCRISLTLVGLLFFVIRFHIGRGKVRNITYVLLCSPETQGVLLLVILTTITWLSCWQSGLSIIRLLFLAIVKIQWGNIITNLCETMSVFSFPYKTFTCWFYFIHFILIVLQISTELLWNMTSHHPPFCSPPPHLPTHPQVFTSL